MGEEDISKVAKIIMENPGLIEEIRSLIRPNEKSEQTHEPVEVKSEIDAANEEKAETAPKEKERRHTELLRAMKPYVSAERGRAIESMLAVADILFALREK